MIDAKAMVREALLLYAELEAEMARLERRASWLQAWGVANTMAAGTAVLTHLLGFTPGEAAWAAWAGVNFLSMVLQVLCFERNITQKRHVIWHYDRLNVALKRLLEQPSVKEWKLSRARADPEEGP